MPKVNNKTTTEIQKLVAKLKKLADTVNGELVFYRDHALNVVIPKTDTDKELYIMTPAHRPILDNLEKAHELLKEHIKKSKKTKKALGKDSKDSADQNSGS